jgi:hypothetical protein
VRVEDAVARVGEISGERPVVVAGEAGSRLDWSPLGPSVRLATDAPHDLPRASTVGRLALGRRADAADDLEPLYVRPPEITMPRAGGRP